MDAVTYPHPDVQTELAGWLQRRVDVTIERELASLFEVEAIPTAIVLDGSGHIRDRIVGFVKPEGFLERLQQARQAR